MESTVQACVNCMALLQRFIKVGLYYPEGHKVAEQEAQALLASFANIADEKSPYVRITTSKSSFDLQDVSLDCNTPPVQQFHDILFGLGISILEIHRDITVEEIRSFLSRLIFLRSKVQGSQGFQAITISDLPATIRLQQHRFVSDGDQESEFEVPTPDQATINTMVALFQSQGLSEEHIAVCRELLESLPEILHKRNIATHTLPHAGWEDIERFMLQAAKSLDQSQNPNHIEGEGQSQSNDTLVAFLRSLDDELASEKTHMAVEMIVSMLKGSAESVESKAGQKKPVPRQDAFDEDIEELLEAYEIIQQVSLPDDFEVYNRSEELSILLQIFDQDNRPYVFERSYTLLRKILSTPLSGFEQRVFIRGIQKLFVNDDPDHLYTVFSQILILIRETSHMRPLAFFSELCQGLTETEFSKCWPFVIDEIFRSDRKEEELFEQVVSIASLLPPERMFDKLPQLERLDMLRDKAIHSSIFSPLPQKLKPLFILLLNSSSARYLYEEIAKGIHTSPATWIERAVGPFLLPAQPTHQEVLFELISLETPNIPEVNVQKKCASIIAQKILATPYKLRHKKWILKAVKAAAQLEADTTTEMFIAIVKSRRYFFLPSWPSAIRKVARDALKTREI